MGQLAEFTVNEIAADGQTYSLAADRAIRHRSLASSRPCLGDHCRPPSRFVGCGCPVPARRGMYVLAGSADPPP